MLNRIRIREATEEDIKVLMSRPSFMLSKSEYEKAIHLFFTNLEVNLHNEKMLNSIEDELVKILANLTAPKGYKANTSVNGLIDNT